MAKDEVVNSRGSHLAINVPPLLECCCCRSSMHDPIQLNCLHYYCRSCFDSNGSRTQLLRSTVVTCPECSEVTEISTVLTNSFLCSYKRAMALRADIVWCSTCKKKSKVETAEFWCVVCVEALCAACHKRHNKFINDHRILQLEQARILPISQLIRSVQCDIHNRLMEAQCFTCCLPKCTECSQSCTTGAHDLHLLSDKDSQEHMSKVENRVKYAAQWLGTLLQGVLQKCRAIASRLQACRINGHMMLQKHRRRLKASTSLVFDKSKNEVRFRVHSIRNESPDVSATGVLPRSCADNIQALVLNGVRSLQPLSVRNLLKWVAASCFLSGKASTVKLRRYGQGCSISIHGSVSLTSDIVLSACFTATDRTRAALRAPLLFCAVPVSFETTVLCYDLAATREGHLLLAAAEHGLLVYSEFGHQMSSWKPARRRDGEDDWVQCVAALTDGEAAVGVYYARHVALVKCNETGETWQEYRRVADLLSPPISLAALGDLLATAESRADEQNQRSQPPGVVNLLRLSSRQLLYTHSRDYYIDRVALSALCIVTTSRDPVNLGSGAMSYLLDAFSHSGQFLWRYKTSDEEDVWGLCVSADSYSRVYVGVTRRDHNSSRVSAISGADGGDSRDVMSSRTHGLQRPRQLSLAIAHERTILAVLNLQKVSLYEAIG